MVERKNCIYQVVHTLIHVCRSSSQIEAHLIGDVPARDACEQLVHQADSPPAFISTAAFPLSRGCTCRNAPRPDPGRQPLLARPAGASQAAAWGLE